jgi:hypothetical protein
MNFPSFNGFALVAQTVCAILVMQLVSGCSSKETGTATQAYKGVINLEGVKLGLPEESAKSAILSFASDPSVPAPHAQYLSRTYDQNGGQYCLAYSNGKPLQVRVVYAQKPISKEEALARLKSILPSSAPEETKIDDSETKAGKKDSPVERRYFGDTLRAELIYADKTAKTVKLVAVATLDKTAAEKEPPASATKASKTGSGESKPQ